MATPTTTPSYFKLQPNVPEIVVLAFSEGRPVQSQFSGDQVMYTLDDGRKWYTSPAIAQQLTAAGIGANMPFEICKREVAAGNRRTIRYDIRPLGAKNETGAPVLPAAAPASNSSINQTTSSSLQSSNTPRPALVPNRERAEAIAAELAAELAKPATVEPEPVGGRLFACYKHAIDLAQAAKKYASERGMLIEPRFEDIRAAAAVLYIEQSRGGRA